MDKTDKVDKMDKMDGGQGDQGNPEQPRKVFVSSEVRVDFTSRSGGFEKESVRAKRDLFSVMDAIAARLERTGSKEEMADVAVTVRSVEDAERSEPPRNGDPRWEGPYMVGGVDIDGDSIPDAMAKLTKACATAEFCVANVERLVEQLFLRSRMDGFVAVCSFDGQTISVPLVSSMRDPNPLSLAALYRSMRENAEALRMFVSRQFPDLKVDWDGDGGSGLVLPNGMPASSRKNGGIIV